MKIPQWVWLAGLVGAGYALYKMSDLFKQGVKTVTKPASDVIASTIIAWDPWLSKPAVQSTLVGSIVFPNGALVPIKNLRVYPAGSEARVDYQNRTYRLSAHDANGNYPATPI